MQLSHIRLDILKKSYYSMRLLNEYKTDKRTDRHIDRQMTDKGIPIRHFVSTGYIIKCKHSISKT